MIFKMKILVQQLLSQGNYRKITSLPAVLRFISVDGKSYHLKIEKISLLGEQEGRMFCYS